MKILLVADLHYALKQFDWLLEEARHYDVVVLAGDLLDLSALATPEAQIVVIRSYLNRLRGVTQLVVCSGNHDLDAEEGGERTARWIAALEGLSICRDGQNIRVGDTLISALPWWDGPRAQAAIEAQLQRDAVLVPEGGQWVWAHHAPPADSGLSWNGARHFGDLNLVRWIETHRPHLVLSGHVHEAPFVPGGAWVDELSGAWCFNMGQQIGPVPSHIAVSLTERQAIWLSQSGPQAIALTPGARPEPIPGLPAWF